MAQNAISLGEDDTARLNFLLSSNEPPSSLDIKLINGSIEMINQYLARLQMRIKQYQQQKLRYKSLLCGVRKLPAEILSEIFVLCTNPRPTIDERDDRCVLYPKPSDYPCRLSQVCRRWRDIAKSMPSLWSCISLPHYTPVAQTKYAGIVQRALELSRQSPLYLTLSISAFGNREQTHKKKIVEAVAGTLDDLMTQISRWRYFDFCAYAYCAELPATSFPAIPSSGAPNLIEACFSDWHHQDHASDAANWTTELLRASPNIRHIIFNALVPSLRVPDAAPISWVHLQTFEAQSGIQIDDLFTVFMSCPCLQTCDVSLDTKVEDPFTHQLEEGIALEHLRTLTIIYIREEQLPVLLRWLTLPSLKQLTLEGAGEMTDDWPDDLFTGLLIRSRCNLEALSLRDLSFSETELITYLQLPGLRDTLEVLEIDQWRTSMSTELLQMLTFKFPDPPPSPSLTLSSPPPPILELPKLKDVTFTINAMVQAVALRHFVASRWYEAARNDVPLPVARLKSIRVYLAVPYVPNVELSIEPIKRVFSRISLLHETQVHLIRHIIQSGPQEQEMYDGIQRLDRLPIHEWTI
ncbi:hypothetical protein GYMLUDRAFT_95525 [Collybiopsis luxurians FD-317 M1]|uniref:F-box domain-containing protein n=1 Tax=Collybiopsis luxurians FD-317 M1 TaxID=944289 RepID=A0A0D0CKK3_9AGAR|nr:hypothetical protein GYMLUDRAFT_95525 [Collybiopsis luxurians FD-317 M1]